MYDSVAGEKSRNKKEHCFSKHGGTMETRKLIKFGKNSYVVTLPQDWVLKNRLTKGMSLFLRYSPDGILISASGEGALPEKKTIIDTTNKQQGTIQREIVTAYANNSKVIELRGSGLKDHAESLIPFIKNFMSLEILEQTTEKIVVADFLNFEDISLDTIAKRVDNIVRVMLEDCFRAFDEDLSENLEQRDQIINRFYFLSYRMVRSGLSDVTLRNRLKMNSISLLEHWQLMQSFETMGDQCKEIAKQLYALKVRKREKKEEIISFLTKMNTMYRDVLKAYYNKDTNLAHKIRDQSKQIIPDLDAYLDRNRASTVPYLVMAMKYFVFNVKDISREVLRRE